MISIIIPALNEEKVLPRTIGFLRKLQNLDYEIIVSDGHSFDATLDIAQRLADKVVVHRAGLRQTIGQGRNLGAQAAGGDFLVFLDADVSIKDPNIFFRKALKLFEKDPKLLALTVFIKVVPEKSTLGDKLFFSLVNRLHQLNNNLFKLGSASGEFQMIRTGAFKKLGGFNERLVVGEDNDMFARLSRIGKTRVETKLHILHDSRRAHSIGWFKLLYFWIRNDIYARFLKRSWSREWTAIR